MYCIQCGIELSDGQTLCPVCNTRVCHPDFPVDGPRPTYPKDTYTEEVSPRGVLFVLTVFATLCVILPVISELIFYEGIGWSGYVAGGVTLAYVVFILPFWFKNPNPVIFVPCAFTGVALYLLYINLVTDGGWFLSFAFPVVGLLGLIATTMTVLIRYLRRGRLYILGGTLMALGAWSALLEFFLWLTFHTSRVLSWSLCTLVTLFALGLMLMVIAMVRPLRESLEKRFFM